MAHIPDGIYHAVGDVLEVLSAPERTVQELTRLAEILRVAQKSPESASVVEKKIESELPALSSLTRLLPKSTSDRLALIGIIIAALGLLKECAPQTVTVQQVIENTYITVNMRAPAPTTRHKTKNKTGRNERCPCGSGKKYKHCCLSGTL
jgi:hypothetical protein